MLNGRAVDSSSEVVSDDQAKKSSADRTNAGQNAPTILQRIAANDKTAVEECINRHGNLIWALAKQLTDSRKEAEVAAQEIFLDLWKHAARFDTVECAEGDFIVLVARRWIIRRKLRAALDSARASGEE